MKTSLTFPLFSLAIVCASFASALTIDTVPVGNAGNTGDTLTRIDSTTGHGAVAYDYRIGKYEVTNAQYTEFLNAVDSTGTNTLNLYSSAMSSNVDGGINFSSGAASGSKYAAKAGHANQPVNLVSWYDTLRFTNWLHNGQGTGSTETGAYTFGTLGAGGVPLAGLSITRNPGATWFLPTEDEWYKAAYHKNNGVTGDYWTYPTQSNSGPSSDQPPGSGAPTPSETANILKDDSLANGYDDGYAVTGIATLNPAQNYLTDVGAYTLSTGPYGTFDQGGNMWELNESLSIVSGSISVLGGGWGTDDSFLAASYVNLGLPNSKNSNTGFRVGHLAAPEPSALLLGMMGLGAGLLRRRRQR